LPEQDRWASAEFLHAAATGREIFEIADDEMEIGMGLHGEPGVERMKPLGRRNRRADGPPHREDLPYRRGDE